MVGLDATGRDNSGSTLGHGLSEQKLEFTNFVSRGGAPCLVVSFDVEFLGEVRVEVGEREGLDGGGAHAEGETVGGGIRGEAGETGRRGVRIRGGHQEGRRKGS